jgi:hypothetical protein
MGLMPSINIGEDDFVITAMAANDAKASGDLDQARKLDKIARKMNAALTAAEPTIKAASWIGGGKRAPVRWQDMPSTIGED